MSVFRRRGEHPTMDVVAVGRYSLRSVGFGGRLGAGALSRMTVAVCLFFGAGGASGDLRPTGDEGASTRTGLVTWAGDGDAGPPMVWPSRFADAHRNTAEAQARSIVERLLRDVALILDVAPDARGLEAEDFDRDNEARLSFPVVRLAYEARIADRDDRAVVALAFTGRDAVGVEDVGPVVGSMWRVPRLRTEPMAIGQSLGAVIWRRGGNSATRKPTVEERVKGRGLRSIEAPVGSSGGGGFFGGAWLGGGISYWTVAVMSVGGVLVVAGACGIWRRSAG